MFHHRAAPFSIKNIDYLGIFSGYASIFNEVDDQGDRVMKGAFLSSLATMSSKSQLPKMLWQHDVSEPIGLWDEIHEDHQGLFVKGKLILELRRAQEAYALMKAKALDSLSIGYRVIEASKSPNLKERYLTQIDLFEISLVTFPANKAAKITHVKTASRETELESIKRLKKTIQVLKF